MEIARMLIEAGAEVDSKDHPAIRRFGEPCPTTGEMEDSSCFCDKKQPMRLSRTEKGVSPVGLARRISNYDVAKFFGDLDN